jgi:hypothetical protein
MSPEAGERIATGDEFCAAIRSRVNGRRKRIFMKLTDKFNMKEMRQSNFVT